MKHTWTDAERQSLIKLFQTHSAEECAQILGVTVSAINNQAHILGLKKSREWIAARARQRWAEGRHENSRAALASGRGWNKGMPWDLWNKNPEASQATQFKAGRAPSETHNYRPIGSTRICKDGYLEKKVSDDKTVYPARRWIGVHRLVWEAANGPIPRGHAVVFKPGLHTTEEAEITLDRIELLTRAELMKRNSYHNRYPKEVARLVQLRGAVTRQINKRRNQE